MIRRNLPPPAVLGEPVLGVAPPDREALARLVAETAAEGSA